MAEHTPSLGQLVAAYTATPDSDTPTSPLPTQIADGINQGTYRLVLVVKELADALTSDNDAHRAKGVGLLSSVVTKVNASVLDRQSTKTLTTFFTDKLSEKASLTASATALAALTESASFGVGEGMEVARGIFSITLKSHAQPVRHTIYVLLDRLMTHCRPALQRLKGEFVSGYAQLVEGEKDPRNLMISFNLIRVMLLEFEVEKNIEDLFDITFCYFPITFTPPPDDPYGISSEDLILALRACLSATPLFGRLALPLFYDKLQAASEKAKRQTLQALEACFPIYGAEASGEWAGRFSEALSIEVFHASDTPMQDLALSTFRSLFATLYPDSLSAPAPVQGGEDVEMTTAGAAEKKEVEEEKIEGVAVQVVENSLDELKEPEKNNAKPAVRILTALIASSARLARYVLSVALPPLLSIYKNPDDVALRPAVLTHISTLLASLAPAPSAPSSSSRTTTPTSITPAPAPTLFSAPSSLSHAAGTSPLEPFRDDLLTLLTSASRTLTTRLGALDALVFLVRLPEFLAPTEVEFCVAAVNEVLEGTAPPVKEPEEGNAMAAGPSGADEEAYDVALDALVVLSSLPPSSSPAAELVERTTLPLLLARLPSPSPTTAPPPRPTSQGSTAYRLALESLAELCVAPRLFAILAAELVQRLEGVLAFPASSSVVEGGDDAALYAHHLLSTLLSVLRVKVAQKDEDVAGLIEAGAVVSRLVGTVVLPTTGRRVEGQEGSVAEDPRVVVEVGKVCGLVLQRVGVERQTTFAGALNAAFHEARLEGLLGEEAARQAGEVPFAPFKTTSPTSQQNLLSLYTSLLLPLSPSVPYPTSDLSSHLRLLLSRSLTAQNELQLQACAWGVASLVNKRVGEDGVKGWLDGDAKGWWEEKVVKEGEESTRRAALRVWIWLTKSLIVRSDPRGYAFVDLLVELFPDAVLGKHAATGLGVIAEEGDGVLSKEKAAVIRLLYKQRFFTHLLPKLVLGYKDTAGHADEQAVYLVALSSLLQHIPKQLTLSELPKLLPLLLTALSLPSPSLRANVIDALSVLVKEVPTEVDNAIAGVASKVVKGLTAGEKGGKGEVLLRLSSLHFLATLPAHIPYVTLHSLKPVVLKELGKAIDDPRREVRRAAVECRGKWYLFSG
ncbi:hypothetical protein JCM8097_007094 [Rhodosporidiobolus ruineniae]